jgi:Family of unknown function (DUF6152)
MRLKGYQVFAIFSLLLVAIPAFAHHSFVAEFDGDKKFTVTGVLTKVDWINPHIAFYLDVKDAGTGKTVTYTFASGPPSVLHKAGLRVADFPIGETVTVTGAPAKDGSKRLGWLQMIKYPDGHVFVYRNGSE